MGKFGKFMAFLLVLIISPIITGFVFSKLWVWFIASTFHLQPLSLIESIGLLFTIGFVFMNTNRKYEEEDVWVRLGKNFFDIIFASGIALLFGWVLTLF